MKQADDLLAEHAKAVGLLCLEWAELEQAVDYLLQPLLGCSDSTLACITASVEKLSFRLAIVKKAVVAEHLSRDWIDWLHNITRRINDEFAPKRNDFVHHRIRLSKGEFRLISRKAVVEPSTPPKPPKSPRADKPQQLKMQQLVIQPEARISTQEVERLTECISTVTFLIAIATLELIRWRSEGGTPVLRPELVPGAKANVRIKQLPHVIVLGSAPLALDYVFE